DFEAIAKVVTAHLARAALATRMDRLHHHPIARLEARTRRRLHHLRESLVADDAALRNAMIEMALEDVEIGAADAGAADAEQGLVWRALGPRDRAGAEAT